MLWFPDPLITRLYESCQLITFNYDSVCASNYNVPKKCTLVMSSLAHLRSVIYVFEFFLQVNKCIIKKLSRKTIEKFVKINLFD